MHGIAFGEPKTKEHVKHSPLDVKAIPPRQDGNYPHTTFLLKAEWGPPTENERVSYGRVPLC
jgi:hypothetical protein